MDSREGNIPNKERASESLPRSSSEAIEICSRRNEAQLESWLATYKNIAPLTEKKRSYWDILFDGLMEYLLLKPIYIHLNLRHCRRNDRNEFKGK